MKFLFASDSFKGTLSSEKTIELLTRIAKKVFPECECSGVVVADGGEGTTDAVISASEGSKIQVKVHGPLMETVNTYYGRLDDTRAIIEMAAASGLPLVPGKLRDPRKTSTYGTGEILKDALDHGFTDISIAIGGSSTNDGGMGCMRALGVKFLDENDNELDGRGEDLIRVHHIDVRGLDPRVKQVNFTVMCDVSNPLCGMNGATYTFGRQKGGTPETLAELEKGMRNYRDVIIREFGINPDDMPGSGAAGGLGTALLVFLNAKLKSGIETVLDLIDFDRRLEGVSLVVTGEGRTDWQSCFGKVMQGVGQRCKYYNIPVVGLIGGMGNGAEDIYQYGIDSLITTVNAVMPLEEALDRAEELYIGAAERMFRLIQIGTKI
ncbi:MAG: Glycerate kinase [Xylanivirga thermophila]|jgi:glycerate 2-kinase|uniref:glycerate kinase family protein n=1 Tax=Xylanivirga thermophila TaxID=2496273 RepID=UPI0039F6200E